MQGHIHKRTHVCADGRESTQWYVVVDIDRGADGRRRQQWHGGFRTRREAEVARARLVSKLHENRYVPRSSMTLGQWVRDAWLPMMDSRVKASTFRGYHQMMDHYIMPALGDRPLQALRSTELEMLYGEMLSGRWTDRPLSPGTVANVHRVVHKALADAVDARVLTDNPATRAKAPRPSRIVPSSIAWWLPAELARFLETTADDRLAAVWRLAAMTGMRRAELLGLRWDDVDLGACRLAVRRTYVDVDYNIVMSSPKGGTARTIDLDRETVRLLTEHKFHQSGEREEWGDAYERNDLVAAWQNGTMIHPQTFSRLFQSQVVSAGLRRIRLHDLRHTHATLLLQAGVPVMIVAERLGHASLAFTLQRYAHALPGAQAAAAAAIADLVARESCKQSALSRAEHSATLSYVDSSVASPTEAR